MRCSGPFRQGIVEEFVINTMRGFIVVVQRCTNRDRRTRNLGYDDTFGANRPSFSQPVVGEFVFVVVQ